MILTSPHRADVLTESVSMTLDGLFRRAAIRHPHAIALCDPPDREKMDGTLPRSLTFIEIDNAVSAIAAKLRRLGLNTDSVVAYQLPNTAESVLTLLGIVRAGMIAAPLPLLWRKDEIVSALARCGATALITATRIGAVDHAAIAMQAAAEHFPIRHVGAFGASVPDGLIPFDDIFSSDSSPPVVTRGEDAKHIALVTFDIGSDGMIAVARSHQQLLGASGSAETRSILCPLALSSFAAIALTIVPWLEHAARLVLHQPFDDAILTTQRREHRCATIVLPGATVAALMEAGVVGHDGGLETVVALWRSSEQWKAALPLRTSLRIVDCLALGEMALVQLSRDATGKPLPPDLSAQRDLFFARSGHVLAARGAMVPDAAFPPGAERGVYPHIAADAGGFVSTSYPCRPAGALEPSGPISGVTQCGGYRFRLADLETRLFDTDPRARIAALPHRLLGHRLAVSAQDPIAAATLLKSMNPLIGKSHAA